MITKNYFILSKEGYIIPCNYLFEYKGSLHSFHPDDSTGNMGVIETRGSSDPLTATTEVYCILKKALKKEPILRKCLMNNQFSEIVIKYRSQPAFEESFEEEVKRFSKVLNFLGEHFLGKKIETEFKIEKEEKSRKVIFKTFGLIKSPKIYFVTMYIIKKIVDGWDFPQPSREGIVEFLTERSKISDWRIIKEIELVINTPNKYSQNILLNWVG